MWAIRLRLQPALLLCCHERRRFCLPLVVEGKYCRQESAGTSMYNIKYFTLFSKNNVSSIYFPLQLFGVLIITFVIFKLFQWLLVIIRGYSHYSSKRLKLKQMSLRSSRGRMDSENSDKQLRQPQETLKVARAFPQSWSSNPRRRATIHSTGSSSSQ